MVYGRNFPKQISMVNPHVKGGCDHAASSSGLLPISRQSWLTHDRRFVGIRGFIRQDRNEGTMPAIKLDGFQQSHRPALINNGLQSLNHDPMIRFIARQTSANAALVERQAYQKAASLRNGMERVGAGVYFRNPMRSTQRTPVRGGTGASCVPGSWPDQPTRAWCGSSLVLRACQ